MKCEHLFSYSSCDDWGTPDDASQNFVISQDMEEALQQLRQILRQRQGIILKIELKLECHVVGF